MYLLETDMKQQESFLKAKLHTGHQELPEEPKLVKRAEAGATANARGSSPCSRIKRKQKEAKGSAGELKRDLDEIKYG